jgi:SAM-dependent methyltransferase
MQASDNIRTPADIYDEPLVPALFQRWAPIVLDEAQVAPGNRVLDVACGTGVLALAAADRVGPGGEVAALDASPEMLAVARRKRRNIEWHEGAAESLPFEDGHFDAVVSQFGMMFFNDRPAALSEMMRVLRPGGRLAVAVCDSLDHSPGYATLAELLERLFGKPVADTLRAPFVLGDPKLLLSLCREAGIVDARVRQHEGIVRFASIASLVSTERACAWTLGGMLDDRQFKQLSREAKQALQPFASPNGDIVFEMPALIVTAFKSSARL